MDDQYRAALETFARGDWADAELQLRAVVTDAPAEARPPLLVHYGEVATALGRYADAERALRAARDDGDPETRLLATALLAELAVERGDPRAAGVYATEARTLAEASATSPATARALRAAARTALARGRYAEAAELTARALELAERLEPADELAVAAALDLRCDLGIATGDTPAATEAARRSLEIRQRLLPGDHPLLAESLGLLGLCAFVVDDFAGALGDYQRALEIVRARLGEFHPRAGLLLHVIADVHEAAGRLDEAGTAYEEALRTLVRALGREHPEVGKALACRAWHFKHTGDLERAETGYRTALELLLPSLGPEHPDTLQAITDLGSVQGDRGDYAGAEQMYRLVLERRRQSLGDDHPSVGESWHNLGWLFEQTGRLGDAEAAYRNAQRIREMTNGAESLDLASTLNGLGWTLHQLERDAEAEGLLLRAYDIQRRLLPPDHLDLAITLDNLGGIYAAQGRWDDAAMATMKALAIETAVLGEQHQQVATSLGNLAFILAQLGDDAGEGLARRSLEMHESALGQGHPDTARARVFLARLLLNRGEFRQAAELQTFSLLVLERALGHEHPEVVDLMVQLGSTEVLAGELERARATLTGARGREVDSGRSSEDNQRIATIDQLLDMLGEAPAEPSAASESGPEPARVGNLETLEVYADLPERWHELHPEDLGQLAVIEAGRVAAGETDRGPLAARLYAQVVHRLAPAERMSLLLEVSRVIEENHGPLGLLMPFLLSDPEYAIVSTAALNYALDAPLLDDDPLTGPRAVLDIARIASERLRRASILSGLVLLGDRRLLPLLDGCWQLLDDDGDAKRTLVNARSSWTSACQVEFLLVWLDAMLEDGDEDTFGTVAAGLVNIARRDEPIQDVERTFPVWSRPDEPQQILAEWSVTDFGKLIEARLRDLTDRESEPKIIPFVSASWGLDS